VLLPHHFGEIAGAVFAREDKVRHGDRFYRAGGVLWNHPDPDPVKPMARQGKPLRGNL
jgi:hypothetical protein